MVERERDIAYLNRFLTQLWPGIADILWAEVTHRAFKEARGLPVRLSRRWTRLDLTRRPAVSAHGPEGLMIRIPGSGAIQFSTRIYLLPRSPYPQIRADVDLSIDVAMSPDQEPRTRVETALHSNALGNMVDRWFSWKDKIRKSFGGEEIEREIGYFGAARYAPAEVPEIPEPERVYPDRPLLDAGINIVLVPESFSESDLPRFDQTVDAVVRTLSGHNENGANEPFFSYRSAFHVWTIKPEQSPEGDHVMGSFRDPRGHHRVALANLARLAAIGRAAERAGPGVSILVFVVNPEAPRFAGRRPTAMTLGNVIMQPLQRTPREDASLLLHELAHTGLARLGDEYILRSRRDERYVGQPLRPLNLTTDRSLEKWRHWREPSTQLPVWDDQPIVGAEGAGYFGGGIWRPARRCAMRQSRRGIPFCAVCREALTNGIRQALGEDQVLLRVDYPSGEHAFVQVTARAGAPVPLAIPAPGDGVAHVSVTPVAGTLPEPWEITAHLAGEGGVDKVVDVHPEPDSPTPRSRFTFTAAAGDRLRLRVTSRCPFAPQDPVPVCEFDLRCVPAVES